jgi:hypothetical protein
MNDTISATDARKNWSKVIDTVVRKKPVFIKRNRDILTFLSLEQLDILLDSFRLRLSILPEDDGSITGVIEELDILANGASEEEVIELLTEDLIEYAEEYMENFDIYYHSSNRRVHFPYVYRVIAHESNYEIVKDMFDIQIEGKLNA